MSPLYKVHIKKVIYSSYAIEAEDAESAEYLVANMTDEELDFPFDCYTPQIEIDDSEDTYEIENGAY